MASLDDILRGLGSGQVQNSGLTVSRLSQAARGLDGRGQQPQPAGQVELPSMAEFAANRDAYITPQQSGGGGFWGSVGGGIIGALNVLDMPRRFIMSGVKEGLDAVGITDGDASWGDFKDQFNDPTFGFGTITGDITGNKWIDRAIGFTGDVLLDPLTYVTGGANAGLRKGMSAAGRQGRFATAGRAALQGADDATVASISRLGGSAVTDAAQREALGLGQRGLRFMGKRIAGTGGIDRAIGNTVARGRNAVTSTDWWTNIVRKPEGLEDVYKTLQQGAGPMRPTEAATVLAYVNARKAGKNSFFKAYESQSRSVVQNLSESERIALTHATEAGDDTALSALLGRIRQDLVDRGAQIGEIENYVPHSWTRSAWDWLRGDSAGAVEFRKVANVDLTAPPSIALERLFKGGKYVFNGTEVDFGKGTIREINDAMRKAFGDGPQKFLEDDAGKLLSKYLNDAATASGVVDAANRLRESSLDTVRMDAFDFVPDEDLNKIANKELADMFKGRKKEVQAQQKALLKETAEAAQAVRLSLSDDIVAFADRQDQVGAKIRAMLGNWAKDKSADAQLARFKQTYADLRDGFAKKAEEAEKAVLRLEKQASDLRAKAAVTGPDQVQAALERVNKQLAKEKEQLRLIREDQQMLPRLLVEQDRLQREVDNLIEIGRDPSVAAEAYAAANPSRAKPQVLDSANIVVPTNSYRARADVLEAEIEALAEAAAAPVPSLDAARAAEEIRTSVAKATESLRLADESRTAAFADLRSTLSDLGLTNGILGGSGTSSEVLQSQVRDLLEEHFRRNPFVMADEEIGQRSHVIRKLASATRKRNAASAAVDEAIRKADEAVEALLDTVVQDDVLGRTVRELFEEERAKRIAAIQNSPEQLTRELSKVQKAIDDIEREIARLDSLADAPSVRAGDVLYPIRRTVEASERAYQKRLAARPKNRDLAEWSRYYQQSVAELSERSAKLMDEAEQILRMIEFGNIDLEILRRFRMNLGIVGTDVDPKLPNVKLPKKNGISPERELRQNMGTFEVRLSRRRDPERKAREALSEANETLAAIRAELNEVYRVLPEDVSNQLEAFARHSKEERMIRTHIGLLENQLERLDKLAESSVTMPRVQGGTQKTGVGKVMTSQEARNQLAGLRMQVEVLRKRADHYRPPTLRRTTAEHASWRARRAAVARAQESAKGTVGDQPIALGPATEAGVPAATNKPLDFSVERAAQARKAVELASGVPTDGDIATLPQLWREMQSVATLNDELFGVRVTGLEGAARKAADAQNEAADVLKQVLDAAPFSYGKRNTSLIRSVNQMMNGEVVTEAMLARMPEQVAARWAQLQDQISSKILRGRAVGTANAQAQIGFGDSARLLPAEQAVQHLEARIRTLGVIRQNLIDRAKKTAEFYNIQDPRAARQPQWDDWFAGLAERLEEIDTLIGSATQKADNGILGEQLNEASRLARANKSSKSRLPSVQEIEELVEASVIGAAIARVSAAIDQGLLPTNAAGEVTEEAFDTAFQRALAKSAQDVQAYYKGLAKKDAELLQIGRAVRDRGVVELSVDQELRLAERTRASAGVEITEKQMQDIKRELSDEMQDVVSRLHNAKRREDKHRSIFRKLEEKKPKGKAAVDAEAEDLRHMVIDTPTADEPIVIYGASAPTLENGRLVVMDANGKKWVLTDDVKLEKMSGSDNVRIRYRENPDDVVQSGRTRDWMSDAPSDDKLSSRNVTEVIDTGGAPIEFVDDKWLRKVGYKEIREEMNAAIDTAAAEMMTLFGGSEVLSFSRAREIAKKLVNTRSSAVKAEELYAEFLTPKALGRAVKRFEERYARRRAHAAYAARIVERSTQQAESGTINAWRSTLGFDSVDPVSVYQVAEKRRAGLREFIREASDRLPEAQKELRATERRIKNAQRDPRGLAARVSQAEFDPYALIPPDRTPEGLEALAREADEAALLETERYVAATDALARVDEVEAQQLIPFDRAREAREKATKLWEDRAKGREAVAKGLRAKAKAVKTAPKQFKNPQAAKDFGDIVTGLGREVQKNGLNNWSVRTYTLLDEYEGMLKRMQASENDLLFFDAMIASAEQQQLASPVFKRVYRDGFEQLGPELLGDAGPQVTAAVSRALKNFETAIDNGEFFKYLEYANRFFKTYATLSPGFHVRNMMSAGFMNFSDGVSLRDHADAFRIWGNIRRGGKDVMDSLSPEEQLAMQATFGSGVAGRFGVEEIGAREGAFKFEKKALDNWAVRTSRAIGENYVEGPIRFAAALAAVRGGANLDQAIGRVARLHFDYSELSKFDRYAKQLVPFYVFASRNAPLQIQQMLTKPRAYAVYRNFVNNVSQDEENEILPKWIRERMGFVAGRDIGVFGGNDIALTPDLPFVNLVEDVSKFNPLDPTRALTDLTPFLKVPLETMVLDRNLFFDSPFYGGTPEKLSYAARSIAPPLAQAQRLLGLGDRYSGREAQSWANYFGIPVRQLSPQVIEAEMRRRAAEGE